MNIEQARTAQVSQTYGARPRALRRALGDATSPSARAPQRADPASLSPEPQALHKAQRVPQGGTAVGTAVGTELVAQLRRQVQSGTYRVDEQSLARKIAERLKADDV